MSASPSDSGKREQAVHRLFARVADQRSGMDCGGAAEPRPETPQTASERQQILSARQPQQTSCSYAAAADQGAAPTLPASSCPVPLEAREALNPANNMPQTLADIPTSSSSSAASSQLSRLNTQRQASSIPMAPLESLPKHQEGGEQQVWMYPSEQMFFNAMKRKGWDPREDDMTAVVAIHNSVNERAWREVMVWESMHASECAMPRLKRFQGKPSDFSPKARLLNTLGFALPFDRHDWIIDRCGREVRYVIDFYSTQPRPGSPVAMFIDARPALDSFEALWDRVKLQASWVVSGRWLQ